MAIPAIAATIGYNAFTGYETFLETLPDAAQRILILNYDGAVRPCSVVHKHGFPCPTVPELLERILVTARTRVVLVSGRELRQLTEVRLWQPRPEVWGCNGLEHLHSDGSYELIDLGADELKALAEADAWLEHEGLEGLAELRTGGIAVHWSRYAGAALQEARTKAFRALSPFARTSNLLLLESDDCLELRIASNRKGDVVRTILSELQPGACVAYIGHELTDEDAFHALQGRGISVVVAGDQCVTDADVRLGSHQQLLQFLSDWLRACGGEA